MSKILVCDDDVQIVEAIEIYLTQEGHEVLKAYDGMEALSILEKEDVELIIIDIMMPKMDGTRTTMKIREKSGVPIIFLSAKSEDTDKILGLNIGADDYVTKPFNMLELMARVRSQLRRYTQLGSAVESTEKNILVYGGLTLDTERKTLQVDGEPVKLTPIEFNILEMFMRNPGKVFSSIQIYEYIWQEKALGYENTVAVHIRHIREKIEINPKEPEYIKVVWGVGYRLG